MEMVIMTIDPALAFVGYAVATENKRRKKDKIQVVDYGTIKTSHRDKDKAIIPFTERVDTICDELIKIIISMAQYKNSRPIKYLRINNPPIL